jgi:hypothetical protein
MLKGVGEQCARARWPLIPPVEPARQIEKRRGKLIELVASGTGYPIRETGDGQTNLPFRDVRTCRLNIPHKESCLDGT